MVLGDEGVSLCFPCSYSLQTSVQCHSYTFFFFFFKLVHNVHAYISHLEMHISNSNTKTTQEECIISEKKKTRQHSCYCSISKYKTDYHNAASVCIVRQVHFVCV